MKSTYLRDNQSNRTISVLLILLSALAVFAAVAFIGTTYGDNEPGDATGYYGTEYPEGIHVEMDADGNIVVTPSDVTYDVEEEDDVIRIILPAQADENDVFVNLLDGWTYEIEAFDGEATVDTDTGVETNDSLDGDALDTELPELTSDESESDDEDGEAGENGYIIITITPPVDGEDGYEASGQEENQNTQEANNNAEEVAANGNGYVGITPFNLTPPEVNLPSGIAIHNVTHGGTTAGGLRWAMSQSSPRAIRLMNNITIDGTAIAAAGTTHIFSDTDDIEEAFSITRNGGTARHFTLTGTMHIWNATVRSDLPAGTGARGGIAITAAAGRLHLEIGSTISHNRASRGGGVLVTTGQLTMRAGATISHNISTITGTGAGGGGGVHISRSSGADNSIMHMHGGTISHNTAAHGGAGIQLAASGESGHATLHMHGGTIEYNTAGNTGGGLHANSDTTVTMQGEIIIHGNEAATSGGGIRIFNTDGMTINLSAGSRITDNTAGTFGGGISLLSSNHGIHANGVTFDGNTAGGNGGAIHVEAILSNANSGNPATRRAVVVHNSTFTNNRATNGGAIYMAVGNLPAGAASTTLVLGQNVTFNNNSASHGMRVDDNLEWRNRSVVHPGVAAGSGALQSASLEWIGVNPGVANPPAGQSPVVAMRRHVFNNYDINARDWNYLREVTYEVIGTAASDCNMTATLTQLTRPRSISGTGAFTGAAIPANLQAIESGTLVVVGFTGTASQTQVSYDVTRPTDSIVVNWYINAPATLSTIPLSPVRRDDFHPARVIANPAAPIAANGYVPIPDIVQVRIDDATDWMRLNHAINTLDPQTIVIHPSFAISGQTEGMVGSTFNLVITDPGDGYTITTVPIGATLPAPANSAHAISVTRLVNVQAAAGADIVLRMPYPGMLTQPGGTVMGAPWVTTVNNLSRHFHVEGSGDFTIGALAGGTLTIDGNADAFAGNRGGIRVSGATAELAMTGGSVVYNNRAVIGGGLFVQNATVTMSGNASIESNHATTTVSDTDINHPSTGRLDAHGGGVFLQNANLTMNDTARIINNEVRIRFINETRLSTPTPTIPIPAANVNANGNLQGAMPFGMPHIAFGIERSGNGGGVHMQGNSSVLTMNNNSRIDGNGAIAQYTNRVPGSRLNGHTSALGGGVFVSFSNATGVGTAGAIHMNQNASISNNFTSIVNAEGSDPLTSDTYNPTNPVQTPPLPPAQRPFTPEYIAQNRRTVTHENVGSGAGVYLEDGAQLMMNNSSRIAGNRSTARTSVTSGGAGIYVHDATVEMRNNAVVGGDSFAERNTFHEGSSAHGAGILVRGAAARVRMFNESRVSFNHVGASNTSGGGGIAVTAGNTLNIVGDAALANANLLVTDDARIHSNSGGGQGGGLSLGGGTVVIQGNAIVERNMVTQSGAGAGISVGGGELRVRGNASVRNHNVMRGTGASSYDMPPAAGARNANNNGSGILVSPPNPGAGNPGGNAAVVHMYGNAQLYGNLARWNGGGVQVNGVNATFNMSGNAQIRNNDAQGFDGFGGGGVWLQNGIFNMDGGFIHSNRALGTTGQYGGGGVMINSAGSNAPAFAPANPRFNLNSGEIGGHTPLNIFGTPTPRVANRAERGGGVRINAGTFNMNGGLITSHRYGGPTGMGAIQEGGGVHMSGEEANFNFRGGMIGDPTYVSANHAHSGGGVWVGNGATFEMNAGSTGSGVIAGNFGSLSGGGVHVVDAEFTMNAGWIYRNSAFHGGGVYVTGGDAEFTMTGGTIGGDFDQGEGNAATYGGGVFITRSAEFEMIDGKINGNTGNGGSGAGVHVRGGADFVMRDGEINENYATDAGGGGVAVGRYTNFPQDGFGPIITGISSFTMYDGEIVGNASIVGGGVLAYMNGIFTMEGGLIEQNEITFSAFFPMALGGGGVAIFADSFFYMEDGIIRDHDILNEGSGLWVGHLHEGSYSIATMNGGRIYDNKGSRGGGVYVHGLRPVAAAAALSAALDDDDYAWMALVLDSADDSSNGIVPLSISRNTFVMTGGYIEENEARLSGGGVYVEQDGDFLMSGGYIRDNQATVNGGGVNITDEGTTFVMTGGMIGHEDPNYGNTAAGGGGVWVGNDATFEMRIAVSGSGLSQAISGFANELSGIMPLSGDVSVITGNTAINGGGVFVDNTTFDMYAGRICNNTATETGGGVFVTGGDGEFTMAGGTIGHTTNATLGNTAVSGGGVTARAGASFVMEQSGTAPNLSSGTIVNNVASGTNFSEGGGGVWIGGIDTTFDMTGGLIERNTAVSGGGVAVVGGALFEMNLGSGDSSGTIQNNTATGAGIVLPVRPYDVGGGGVYLASDVAANPSRFILNAGVIGSETVGYGNYTPRHGGGIFVRRNATFEMNGGYIVGNEAGQCGGGVNVGMDDGNFMTMNDGMIGGAEPGSGNVAGTAGGGVRLGANTSFMTGGYIVGNLAPEGGGVRIDGDTATTFMMTDGTIEQNRANFGGGVSVTRIFDMMGGVIENNRRNRLDNNAVTAGGGVWVNGEGASFSMTGGVIGDEDRDYGNRALNGGGVWVGAGSSFAMGNGTILGNEATSDGGGVHVTGSATVSGNVVPSSFNMTGGTIGGDPEEDEGNTAQNGGGVWVGDGASFDMRQPIMMMSDNEAGSLRDLLRGARSMAGGTIVGNVATSAVTNAGGGGVFVTGRDSTFDMLAGFIRENNALNGGGVNLTSGGRMDLLSGQIHRNDATVNGGGVFVSSPVPVVSGDLARIPATLNMSGGTIGGDSPAERNTANRGAGALAGNGGRIEMTGGTISHNASRTTGGGIEIAGGATGTGGLPGIDSTFVMRSGLIANNTAVTNGGGVLQSGIFHMYGGTIGGVGQANEAIRGGGVHVVMGTFDIRGSDSKEISNNEAHYGGGVYVVT
ncbi:MAG: hypothetical protein FWE06_05385, partial [Oscillospiraceae bacterium]|nr:hypothetical protein [Oscillospiraceae bacterium]